MKVAIAVVVISRISTAWADGDPPPAHPDPTTEPAPAPGRVSPDDDMLGRIDELERQLARLQQRADTQGETISKLKSKSGMISVFVDVGAFAVGGNGSGIRSDLDHVQFPQYANTVAGEWVFMGDPLSTAINALGEPADTASSREDSHDTLHSGGHASLIVNSLGLDIAHEVGDRFAVKGLVELLPRPGSNILDIELANIEYRPSDERDLRIAVGKVDSVLGVEYRNQDATNRTTVTPSLICRYTCGRPYGVTARLIDGGLSASAALVDGDFFSDLFEPHLSIKANNLPTTAAHVQWTLKVGASGTLELGASAALGPQDNQPDLHILQWHYGFDLALRQAAGLNVIAEFVQGKQPGRNLAHDTVADMTYDVQYPPCDRAECLTYKGAYVLADYRFVDSPMIPYARVDWRDATHQDGNEFVYVANVIRATVGVHASLSAHVAAKLEYTWNHEIGVPQFADDVLTSSLVVSTE